MQLTYSAHEPVVISNEDTRMFQILMNLLPEHDSTFWKEGRLKTYKNWPFQSNDNGCNPERMAAAGFLFIGGKDEPDLVECFLCGKELDGWEPEDDPWEEHVKHMGSCPFVKLNKPNESLWTVQDLYEMFKKYLVKQCNRELEVVKTKAKQESSTLAGEIPHIYKGLRRSMRE